MDGSRRHGDRYSFGAWRALVKDADGTILSTKTAGGFVGVILGMYAYAAQAPGGSR